MEGGSSTVPSGAKQGQSEVVDVRHYRAFGFPSPAEFVQFLKSQGLEYIHAQECGLMADGRKVSDQLDEDLALAQQLQLEEEDALAASRARRNAQEQASEDLMRSLVECMVCHKSIAFGEDKVGGQLMELHCGHAVCSGCLNEDALQQATTIDAFQCPVPNCSQVLQENEINAFAPRALHAFQQASCATADLALVKCPSCGVQYEVIQQNEDISTAPSHGADGRKLSEDARKHFAQYRVRCREQGCNVEFCSSCLAQPYHIGFDCESHRKRSTCAPCRFCGEPAAEGKAVCGSVECIQHAQNACNKKLACGRFCCGTKGEDVISDAAARGRGHGECTGCLVPSCSTCNSVADKEDFCSICYMDTLGQAPCITLSCGHVFHFHCILERLNLGFPGPRITFNHLSCPQCNMIMSHNLLKAHMESGLRLMATVTQKAKQRIDMEGKGQHPQVQKGGAFEGKLSEYSLRRFAYYICHKCGEAYFGGHRQCEAAVEDEQRQFKPEDLVCGGCAAVGVGECKEHGNEYIEFKCCFCCNIASWFCWGTTHFCDDCHKKQGKPESMSRKKREDLPKCKGPGKCPSGGRHPLNGEEFILGCALCRTHQAF